MPLSEPRSDTPVPLPEWTCFQLASRSEYLTKRIEILTAETICWEDKIVKVSTRFAKYFLRDAIWKQVR